jgi:2-dehydro-3-deoxygalactonokinase
MGVQRGHQLQVQLAQQRQVAALLLEHRVDQHAWRRGRVGQQVGVGGRGGVEQLAEDHVASVAPTTLPRNMIQARLLALDWGTSNLRAHLLGPGGALLDSRAAAGGIMAVAERRFEATLRSLCGDWISGHAVPLVASGMIGSRQGWVEAPYLACPATPDAAAAQMAAVPLAGGGTLHIVPGLICTGPDGQADVMRGEETQLWGAGLAAGDLCVLPGTHSKWAWVGAGEAITQFQTYMTGELYAVLVQHSILGRLMEAGTRQRWRVGRRRRLGLAEHAHLSHLLFAARTAGLTGARTPRSCPTSCRAC